MVSHSAGTALRQRDTQSGTAAINPAQALTVCVLLSCVPPATS